MNAPFELGEHVLEVLHKGVAVFVVGHERTVFGGEGESLRSGRALEVDAIGLNSTRATGVVAGITQRTPRRSTAQAR